MVGAELLTCILSSAMVFNIKKMLITSRGLCYLNPPTPSKCNLCRKGQRPRCRTLMQGGQGWVGAGSLKRSGTDGIVGVLRNVTSNAKDNHIQKKYCVVLGNIYDEKITEYFHSCQPSALPASSSIGRILSSINDINRITRPIGRAFTSLYGLVK